MEVEQVAMPVSASVLREAEQIFEEVRDLRRALHRHPECGLNLPLTQEAVLRRLAPMDALELTAGSRLSSITAVLRGQGPLPAGTRRPVVLLRADMDALPIIEDTGLEFSSENVGVMHACGHDLHAAALVGAASVLHEHRRELIADVVFMFQPAEETYFGAKYMIEEGVIEAAGRRADAAFGLHVQASDLPAGVFASRPGPLMAGCDELHARVVGLGGHGSTPHVAKDPVPVVAEIVLALQTLAARGYDPFDPVVITVGRIQAGSAGNVIPDFAEFDATVRMFSPQHRERLISDIERICQGITAAHGLSVELSWAEPYPVTVADPGENEYAASVVRGLLGAESYQELKHPYSASEDFARVLREVPGTFLSLGARPIRDHPQTAGLHSAQVTFDESVLPRAVACLASLALNREPVMLGEGEDLRERSSPPELEELHGDPGIDARYRGISQELRGEPAFEGR
ncbi:MAG TPA: M20 family metallopeptidase [Sinomonas sp.]|nr:M20 family metallopeptidase [Sinomonas sp.]